MLLNTLLYVLWAVGVPLGIAATIWWIVKARDRLRLAWNAYQHERSLNKWLSICQEYYTIGQIYMPVGDAIMKWDVARPGGKENSSYVTEEACIMDSDSAMLLLGMEVQDIEGHYNSTRWDPKMVGIQWEFFCDEKKMRYQIIIVKPPAWEWRKTLLPYHLPFISPQDMAIHSEILTQVDQGDYKNFFKRAYFDDKTMRKMRYKNA